MTESRENSARTREIEDQARDILADAGQLRNRDRVYSSDILSKRRDSGQTEQQVYNNLKNTFFVNQKWLIPESELLQSASEIAGVVHSTREDIFNLLHERDSTSEITHSRLDALKAKIDHYHLQMREQKIAMIQTLSSEEQNLAMSKLLEEDLKRSPYSSREAQEAGSEALQAAQTMAESIRIDLDTRLKTILPLLNSGADLSKHDLDQSTKEIISKRNDCSYITKQQIIQERLLTIAVTANNREDALTASINLAIINELMPKFTAEQQVIAAQEIHQSPEPETISTGSDNSMLEIDNSSSAIAKEIRNMIDNEKRRVLTDNNLLSSNPALQRIVIFLNNPSATTTVLDEEALRYIHWATGDNGDCRKKIVKDKISDLIKRHNRQTNQNKIKDLTTKFAYTHDQHVLHAAVIELCEEAKKRINPDPKTAHQNGEPVTIVFDDTRFGRPQKITITDSERLRTIYRMENLGKFQITGTNMVMSRLMDIGVITSVFNLIPCVMKGLTGQGWDFDNPYIIGGLAATVLPYKVVHEKGVGLWADPHVNFAHRIVGNMSDVDRAAYRIFNDPNELNIFKMIDWHKLRQAKKRLKKTSKEATEEAREANRNNRTTMSERKLFGVGAKREMSPQDLQTIITDEVLLTNNDHFQKALGLISNNPKKNNDRLLTFELITSTPWIGHDDLHKVSSIIAMHHQAKNKSVYA